MDDGHIGVLDLGCTRELLEALGLAYVSLGMLDTEITAESFRDQIFPAVGPIQSWMVEPLRHEVFDFAQLPPAPLPSEDDQKVLARTMAGIHAELPSFDRAWIGTLHILRQLGARVRTAGDSSLTEFSGRES